MGRRSLLVPILLSQLSLAAAAEEFVYGFRADATYDDNIFFDAEGETDDLLLRAGPRLELRDRAGDLQWNLRYQPQYEWYTDTDDIDGWSHDVEGAVTWKLDPRTTLKVSNRFRSLNQIGSAVEVEETPAGDVETTVGNRDRLEQNRFSASLDHTLTQRQVLSARFDFNSNDYDDPGRRDSEVLSAQLNYAYLLTPRDRLGGGFQFTRQEFDAISGFDSTETLFYNLFGQWAHEFDRTLILTLSAGPTLIDADEQDVATSGTLLTWPTVVVAGEEQLVQAGSCTRFPDDACRPSGFVVQGPDQFIQNNTLTPVALGGAGVPSVSDTELTYFARISLRKRWENLTGELLYSRDANTTSGIGSSTVSDYLLGSLVWQPSPKFRGRLEASWLRRQSATESLVFRRSLFAGSFPSITSGAQVAAQTVAGPANLIADTVDDSVDRERIGVNLLLSYRWNERVRLYLNSYWSSEDFEGERARDDEVERLRSVVGIEYQFRPIQL